MYMYVGLRKHSLFIISLIAPLSQILAILLGLHVSTYSYGASVVGWYMTASKQYNARINVHDQPPIL